METAADYDNGVKWRCEHCDRAVNQQFFELTANGDLPKPVQDDFAAGLLFTICEKCTAGMKRAGTYSKYFG